MDANMDGMGARLETVFPGKGTGEAPEGERAVERKTETAEAAEPQKEEGLGTRFSIRALGKEHCLTLEELKENAQKGLDYDGVRRDRDRLRRLLQERSLGRGEEAGEERKRHEEILRFCRQYPGVHQLPTVVLDAIQRGEELTDAYREYEISELRRELEAERKMTKNRGAVLGSVFSDAPALRKDDFLEGFWQGR